MTNIAKKYYSLKSRGFDPTWKKGTVPIPDNRKNTKFTRHWQNQVLPFESCLIHHNSEKPDPLLIKTKPKWPTELNIQELDEETGELIIVGTHLTNEMKQSNNRKIKALERFCNHFEPLYRKKLVTLFFHTFTRLNHANIEFSDMLDNIKYHYEKQLKKIIKGYIWVLEVSSGYHSHYHLCIAIERTQFDQIPEALKFEELWGQRTQVTIIKKSIKRYLSKYIAKEQFRIMQLRSYGISRKFK